MRHLRQYFGGVSRNWTKYDFGLYKPFLEHLSPGTGGSPDTCTPQDETDQFVAHSAEYQYPNLVEHLQSPDFVRSYNEEQKNKVVQSAAQFLFERVLPAPAISAICHTRDDTAIACLMKENGT